MIKYPVPNDDETEDRLEHELSELRSPNAALTKPTIRHITTEHSIDEGQLAESIVETIRESLLVLNADLKIILANPTFFRTFKVLPSKTLGNFIYELGNGQWDIPILRQLLGDILHGIEKFDDFEVAHDFQGIGRKFMLLNARRIYRKDIGSQTILLAIEDITDHRLAEEKVKELNALLELNNAQLIAANTELEAVSSSERKKAVEELRESNEKLRNLAAHLQTVREEERTKIAREIHDELGQALTVFKMDLAEMQEILTADQGIETLPELVKTDRELVNATMQTVKRICTELRPALLDHLGLGAALEWQAAEFQKRNGIECELNLIPDDITVDEECSTALFRIFQESLTNVLRYAKATKVKATLSDQGNGIMLEIADNGIGITNENMLKANSFGLLGMRERVHICNGEMRIAGSPNAGSTITVIIPK